MWSFESLKLMWHITVWLHDLTWHVSQTKAHLLFTQFESFEYQGLPFCEKVGISAMTNIDSSTSQLTSLCTYCPIDLVRDRGALNSLWPQTLMMLDKRETSLDWQRISMCNEDNWAQSSSCIQVIDNAKRLGGLHSSKLVSDLAWQIIHSPSWWSGSCMKSSVVNQYILSINTCITNAEKW